MRSYTDAKLTSLLQLLVAIVATMLPVWWVLVLCLCLASVRAVGTARPPFPVVWTRVGGTTTEARLLSDPDKEHRVLAVLLSDSFFPPGSLLSWNDEMWIYTSSGPNPPWPILDWEDDRGKAIAHLRAVGLRESGGELSLVPPHLFAAPEAEALRAWEFACGPWVLTACKWGVIFANSSDSVFKWSPYFIRFLINTTCLFVALLALCRAPGAPGRLEGPRWRLVCVVMGWALYRWLGLLLGLIMASYIRRVGIKLTWRNLATASVCIGALYGLIGKTAVSSSSLLSLGPPLAALGGLVSFVHFLLCTALVYAFAAVCRRLLATGVDEG